jgi:hypothetical protein
MVDPRAGTEAVRASDITSLGILRCERFMRRGSPLMTVTAAQVAWPLLRQVRSGHTHVDPVRR